MKKVDTIDNLSVAGGIAMFGFGLIIGASISGLIGFTLLGFGGTYVVCKALQVIWDHIE